MRLCSFEGCDRKHKARGYCIGHYNQMLRGETVRPLIGTIQFPISYPGAHKRVLDKYGPAKTHACADCGGTASDWSYNHKSNHERWGWKEDRFMAFSPIPEDYEPRCKPCHRKYDLGERVYA